MEKTTPKLNALTPRNIWEDLVLDFLEMACFLKNEEQEYLVRELGRQRITDESIDTHPCFSINGKIVVVCDTIHPKQCWFYFVKKRQIQKWNGTQLPDAA